MERAYPHPDQLECCKSVGWKDYDDDGTDFLSCVLIQQTYDTRSVTGGVLFGKREGKYLQMEMDLGNDNVTDRDLKKFVSFQKVALIGTVFEGYDFESWKR